MTTLAGPIDILAGRFFKALDYIKGVFSYKPFNGEVERNQFPNSPTRYERHGMHLKARAIRPGVAEDMNLVTLLNQMAAEVHDVAFRPAMKGVTAADEGYLHRSEA